MSEENIKTLFSISEDGEGNIQLDIKGKGGELVQVIASVIDDDPDIKQLFEMAIALVNMKQAAEAEEADELVQTESTFFKPPTAEA
jgi:hypothetical protein